MNKQQEFENALLKSSKPSVYFNELRESGRLKTEYPELDAMIGVPQNQQWHQEGDVWNHTMLVVDKAATFRDTDVICYPYGFMLAALCHDLGKIVATTEINGKIHAYQHEEQSGPLARKFLERIGVAEQDIVYVENLAELHMKPHHSFTNNSAIKKTNKMFDEAVQPIDLIYLAVSDSSGCLPAKYTFDEEQFLLERLSVYNEAMKAPYVTAEDIVNMGVSPDTDEFYHILEFAHKLRLAMVEKDNALRQVKSCFGIRSKTKDDKCDRGH